MSVQARLDISGIQAAQNANARLVASVKPSGNLERAIKAMTIEAERRAVIYTHVDTGALRASHRVELAGPRGRVYIDPSSVNPRTKQKPSVYGVYERDRGGEHDFYGRVVNEASDLFALGERVYAEGL